MVDMAVVVWELGVAARTLFGSLPSPDSYESNTEFSSTPRIKICQHPTSRDRGSKAWLQRGFKSSHWLRSVGIELCYALTTKLTQASDSGYIHSVHLLQENNSANNSRLSFLSRRFLWNAREESLVPSLAQIRSVENDLSTTS